MFGGYWYVGPAPDGHIYCWAKEPSFICPAQDLGAAARRPDTQPGPELTRAAELMGVDARWLAMRVAGGSHGRTRDDRERLTDRCTCGARMTRLGYAYWTERPRTEEELEEPGARISQRLLGGDAHTHIQDGERRYQDTKKEAEAWARRQLSHAKAGTA